ncbi:hypothetical protein IMG5_145840 [Ichthyophthirius multifiliis]|uniref:Histidine kinase domain-containing protein n=1 Tax=Ichthyophthirius multifiliis TaxID=5932 RepID=G0QXX7_ICHMU|nr:hypothetical protein IMG5_145840 [Ichthyophthirius multifiliis]EGR29929.1 hypothetical protein IMG5_145840 [Ichthyophthirius multifiliis]|eukprot:XP_004031165.1 hypothetical protein IMG5_145840 [Ichthyophthirius multifiliis]
MSISLFIIFIGLFSNNLQQNKGKNIKIEYIILSLLNLLLIRLYKYNFFRISKCFFQLGQVIFLLYLNKKELKQNEENLFTECFLGIFCSMQIIQNQADYYLKISGTFLYIIIFDIIINNKLLFIFVSILFALTFCVYFYKEEQGQRELFLELKMRNQNMDLLQNLIDEKIASGVVIISKNEEKEEIKTKFMNKIIKEQLQIEKETEIINKLKEIKVQKYDEKKEIIKKSNLSQDIGHIDSELFDIGCIMAEIMDIYWYQVGEKNLKVKEKYEIRNIKNDKKRIKQVLFEIIGNAIKYTDKGKIQISTKEENKDFFWIKISDTGKGMTESVQNNLFNVRKSVMRVSLEKNKFAMKVNAGLGLEFTRKMAGILGPFDKVFIQSGENQGSSFKILLFKDWDQRQNANCEEIKKKIVKDLNQNNEEILTPDYELMNKGTILKAPVFALSAFSDEKLKCQNIGINN